jgi:hypothetical protein
MEVFAEIMKYIQTFEKYGCKEYENGTKLYGHAPFIAPKAYSFRVFSALSEQEVAKLEQDMNREIPIAYRSFLMKNSNGLNLFNTTLCFDGLRKSYCRNLDATPEPFSLSELNRFERPKNAKESYFFIGGYDSDLSKLYINSDDGTVHFCKRWDATSLLKWNSFEEMILLETRRLLTLHNDRGELIVPHEKTLPI